MDKFGSWEDYKNNEDVLKKYVCEIMVHPDYDANGVLIDRVKVIEYKNIGQALGEIANLLDKHVLISYNEV